MLRTITLSLFATAFLCSTGLPVLAAAPYHFTILAENGQTIDGQTIFTPENAVTNSKGDVVFDAWTGSGPARAFHVYRTSFVPSKAGPVLVGAGSKPQLDNSGTILFGCGGGLCTQSGPLVKRGSTIGGQTIQYLDSWAMSRNGRILFTASWTRQLPDSTTLNQYGLFTPTAILLRTCEYVFPNDTGCYAGGATGSVLEGKQLLVIAFPAINNAGEIAFTCAFALAQDGICTTSQIVDYTGSVIGGDTLTLVHNPKLNSRGELLFHSDFDPNGTAMFTPSRVLVQSGDTVGGCPVVFVNGGSMNDSGDIVFIADCAQPGTTLLTSGLFTPSGPVLKAGDQIAGQTVTQILDASINNNGDILITAAVSNGSAHGSAIIAASRH